MELLYSNHAPAKISNRTARKIWEENISKADFLRIATGYISSDSLIELKKIIEDNERPKLDLLVGMHYFEGFSKQQYDSVISLNETLKQKDRGTVFLSNAIKFHGKLYSFIEQGNCIGAIVGSSNLSSILNSYCRLYEVDCYFSDSHANEIDLGIQKLISSLGTKFDDIPEIRTFIENDLLLDHYGVKKLTPEELASYRDKRTDTCFEIPVKTEPKSNLNIYFGKGRVTPRGFIMPRPWYEAELIVSTSITRLPNYPVNKSFEVITNDGWSFRCKTNGQNCKNFRSQNDLKILGKWIKGKLERSGKLKIGNPVTDEVLEAYGRKCIKLTATTDTQIWLLDF
jgi:HKD family nuclease